MNLLSRLVIGIVAGLSLAATTPASAQRMPLESELALPIATNKPVIAHHMTMQVQGCQMPLLLGADAYRPDRVNKSIGGFMHVLPQLGQRTYASIEEARAFEITCAREVGVDGFGFYYPLTKRQDVWRTNNRIISEFYNSLRSPGNEHFLFSLWFADSSLEGSLEERAQEAAHMVNDL